MTVELNVIWYWNHFDEEGSVLKNLTLISFRCTADLFTVSNNLKFQTRKKQSMPISNIQLDFYRIEENRDLVDTLDLIEFHNFSVSSSSKFAIGKFINICFLNFRLG